jgi:hypothetical protein
VTRHRDVDLGRRTPSPSLGGLWGEALTQVPLCHRETCGPCSRVTGWVAPWLGWGGHAPPSRDGEVTARDHGRQQG